MSSHAKRMDMATNLSRDSRKLRKQAQELQNGEQELEKIKQLFQRAVSLYKHLAADSIEFRPKLAKLTADAEKLQFHAQTLRDTFDIIVQDPDRPAADLERLERRLASLQGHLGSIRDGVQRINENSSEQENIRLMNEEMPLIDATFDAADKEWKKAEKVSKQADKLNVTLKFLTTYVAHFEAIGKGSDDALVEIRAGIEMADDNLLDVRTSVQTVQRNVNEARKLQRNTRDLLERTAASFARAMSVPRQKADTALQHAADTLHLLEAANTRRTSQRRSEHARRQEIPSVADPPEVHVFVLEEAVHWLLTLEHGEWTAEDVEDNFRIALQEHGTSPRLETCSHKAFPDGGAIVAWPKHRAVDEELSATKKNKKDDRVRLDPGKMFAWHYFLPHTLRPSPHIVVGGGLVVHRDGEMGIGSLTLVSSVHARAGRNIVVVVPSNTYSDLVRDAIGKHYYDVNIQQILPRSSIEVDSVLKQMDVQMSIVLFKNVAKWERSVNHDTSIFLLNPSLDKLDLEQWFSILRRTREVFFFFQELMHHSPSELIFVAGVLQAPPETYASNEPGEDEEEEEEEEDETPRRRGGGGGGRRKRKDEERGEEEEEEEEEEEDEEEDETPRRRGGGGGGRRKRSDKERGEEERDDENIWTKHRSMHKWKTFAKDAYAITEGVISLALLEDLDRIFAKRISWYDPFAATRSRILEEVLILENGEDKPYTTFIQLGVTYPSTFQLQNALFTQGLAPNCLNPKKSFLFARRANEEQDANEIIRETAMLTLEARIRTRAIDRHLY